MPARLLLTALRRLSAFRRDRSGNVALMFGLLLLPMLGAVGLAVDFGTILTARNLAQVGADAAVLQATGVARDLIKKGTSTEAEIAAALTEAKASAAALFDTYAIQNRLGQYSFNVDVTREDQKLRASAHFTVERETYLAKLYGQARYEATGAAVSTSSVASYVDVHIATDISQSMGIAATDAEMTKLYAATKAATGEGCVFGCHVTHIGGKPSNEKIAETAGIRLRIDVIRDAVRQMIAKAKDTPDGTALYRFALMTMGGDSASGFTRYKLAELSALSSDFNGLDVKAGGIDLGATSTAGNGDSYFEEPLRELRSKLAAGGDGKSQPTARRFLFLMTDGLRDTPTSALGGWCIYGNHCMGTIDPATCKTIKDKNITLAVLYTTFAPIYSNTPINTALEGNYINLVRNPKLEDAVLTSKLEQCATPGWFFKASDADAIKSAIAKMFDQISQAPSLTQ